MCVIIKVKNRIPGDVDGMYPSFRVTEERASSYVAGDEVLLSELRTTDLR